MPAAVLIGGLVAIAFAFAAIAAALVVETLVIGPLQNAASSVSETAVVGGVLAWMLTQLVNFIRYSLAGVKATVATAEKQAADWWNYLVGQTVITEFAYWWQQLAWLRDQEGWISWLESTVPSLYNLVHYSIQPVLAGVDATVHSIVYYVYGQLVPWVTRVDANASYALALVQATVIPWVRRVADDVAGLRQWVDANAATRAQLAAVQAAILARLATLATTVEGEIADINERPCMKACEPLGDLGQFLQALEDAGFLALMAALLEESINNPGTVAQVLRDDFVPLVHDAASTFGIGR